VGFKGGLFRKTWKRKRRKRMKERKNKKKKCALHELTGYFVNTHFLQIFRLKRPSRTNSPSEEKKKPALGSGGESGNIVPDGTTFYPYRSKACRSPLFRKREENSRKKIPSWSVGGGNSKAKSILKGRELSFLTVR